MADQRISALPSGSPLVSSDQFVIARGATNYKVTLADIIAAVGAGSTPTLAAVLAAGADAGGHEITNLGAPSAQASAAQQASIDKFVFNTVAATAYTVGLSDIGDVVSLTAAGATTVTFPPQSSVAWDTGDAILFRQFAGAVTFVAGAGVTLHSRGDLFSLAGVYAWATAVRLPTVDHWELYGDLA